MRLYCNRFLTNSCHRSGQTEADSQTPDSAEGSIAEETRDLAFDEEDEPAEPEGQTYDIFSLF